MRASGLAHVLAISGLHIGLVAGAVFLLVARLLATNSAWAATRDLQRPAAAAAAAAVVGYAVIAGLSASVMRASLMSLLYLAAVWVGGGRGLGHARRSLALAAVAVSLAVPGSIREVGFQLSFTAVTALVVYAGLARNKATMPALLGCYRTDSCPAFSPHFPGGTAE
jgi:competence protein ComEC